MPTPEPERNETEDLAACRAMLRHGSRSFFAASLLLPRRVRDPATALYAFCRAADDAVDAGRQPDAAVEDLRDRLDAVYAGRPRAQVVDRAFAAVVVRHGLPRVLPDLLIEGFAWDAEGRRYGEAADLEAYAVRVAGTVGVMMAVLMGRRDEVALARAADLGIAMQYTNIARDVGDDARAGRLYLPTGWLTEAGIDPDRFLAQPAATPAVAAVVGRLLALADRHYRLAAGGIGLLPRDCRPAIDAARRVYREIGRRLCAEGCDPVGRRTVVPGGRKIVLLAASAGAAVRVSAASREPAAPAARDLVAKVAAPVIRPAGSGERLIDILTAVETRRRAQSGFRPVRAGR